MDNNSRLDRIEAKLDKLNDAIIALARMEEKVITLFNRMDRYDTDQSQMFDRVAKLERLAYGRGFLVRWLDRAGVAILGAGIALAFRFFG